MEKNLDLVEALRQIGKEKGATPAQLALAWARTRGADIVPVIGARRRSQLEETLGALALTLMPPILRVSMPPYRQTCTSGERYDPTQMAHLDSEAQH